MAKIKPIGAIADKWAEVTPARSGDYEAGIRDASVDWAGPTSAAADAYAAGVQAAVADGRFGRGVSAAGTQKWRNKALATGVQRWGPGVRAAKSDYQAGFGPYREVIAGIALPPRYARGDPRNLDRVAAITTALHEAKVSGI